MVSKELPSVIRSRIERAIKYPLSEMDTQRIIIEPLLMWIGYDVYNPDEVAEQVSVVGAGRRQGTGAIDYVLSKGKKAIVLVEAKKFSATPESLVGDRLGVQQISTYCSAHPHHPRWGVLTNGVLWAIYDTKAQCDIFSRCVLTVDVLKNPELLKALSKDGLGVLTRFADELDRSRTVSDEGIRGHAIRSIESTFRASLLEGSRKVVPEALPQDVGKQPQIASYRKLPPTYARPVELILPTGSILVKTWVDVLVGVAEFLAQKGELRAFKCGKRPVVSEGPLIGGRKLSNGWDLETNWCASDMVKLSGEAFLAARGDPDCFSVTFVPRKTKQRTRRGT